MASWCGSTRTSTSRCSPPRTLTYETPGIAVSSGTIWYCAMSCCVTGLTDSDIIE